MYAVIFHSQRNSDYPELYAEKSAQMEQLVKESPGYIKHTSFRDQDTGIGVTISYFADLDSIKTWRNNPAHREVQELGRTHFYLWYRVEIMEIDKTYDWNNA